MADDDDEAGDDETHCTGDGGEDDGHTDTWGFRPAEGADGHYLLTMGTLLASRQSQRIKKSRSLVDSFVCVRVCICVCVCVCVCTVVVV